MRSRDALLALTLVAFSGLAHAGVNASAIGRASTFTASDLRTIWPQRMVEQRWLLSASHKHTKLGLFVVRFDSKASGDGFCGAGSEDYLVLARMGKRTARPLVAQRIQSCLETQSLSIDDGDDLDALVRHLQPDPARCAVSFEPLTDEPKPRRVSVYIDAAHGRLVRDEPPKDAAQILCAAIEHPSETAIVVAPPATDTVPR